jgi:hypothetical protein
MLTLLTRLHRHRPRRALSFMTGTMRLGLALAAIGACTVAMAVPAQAADAGAMEERLTAPELRALYSGKTWVWKFGGGYFAPNGRFHAVGGSVAKPSVVDGGWYADNLGMVCIHGWWHSQSFKPARNVTCFEHVRMGGRVWQRKFSADSDGRWYVFDTARSHRGEVRKLKPGDRIGKAFVTTARHVGKA